MAGASQKQVEVGSVADKDLGHFQVRIFTPEGDVPEGGWPGMMWLHGGGWVIGGLNSENGFLRHVCKCEDLAFRIDRLKLTDASDVQCMVISVNYRHAPEHVYPAAIDDSVSGLQWILDHAASISLNPSRLAVGGLSA